MPLTLQDFETLSSEPITAVTADGGCRLKNPSVHGGMWAMRWTDAASRPVRQASGVVTVAEVFPLTTVTNNLTETLALLIGLEAMPDGWTGKGRTDSLNAIRVFLNIGEPKKLKNLRVWLTSDILDRVRRVLERLGKIDFELLSGHPSAADVLRLEAGEAVLSERGYPYCIHNHWCDTALPGAWHRYEGAQL
jgi:ribonuclease HI